MASSVERAIAIIGGVAAAAIVVAIGLGVLAQMT